MPCPRNGSPKNSAAQWLGESENLIPTLDMVCYFLQEYTLAAAAFPAVIQPSVDASYHLPPKSREVYRRLVPPCGCWAEPRLVGRSRVPKTPTLLFACLTHQREIQVAEMAHVSSICVSSQAVFFDSRCQAGQASTCSPAGRPVKPVFGLAVGDKDDFDDGFLRGRWIHGNCRQLRPLARVKLRKLRSATAGVYD
ncbi:hypothetical protein FZEAL_5273 [Fusarium zealandicum]|uniref:Uncharacterized protein n=1 Tax=Fusarium zealandicum TaxID=1053134 RepID=A0A8H4XKZ9_9HYPO|nr:hypothetical protein FZEAL_5273 [Fusarium zealandicum]